MDSTKSSANSTSGSVRVHPYAALEASSVRDGGAVSSKRARPAEPLTVITPRRGVEAVAPPAAKEEKVAAVEEQVGAQSAEQAKQTAPVEPPAEVEAKVDSTSDRPIRMRFTPRSEKRLTLSDARIALLNRELASRLGGKLVLRTASDYLWPARTIVGDSVESLRLLGVSFDSVSSPATVDRQRRYREEAEKLRELPDRTYRDPSSGRTYLRIPKKAISIWDHVKGGELQISGGSATSTTS